MIVAIDERQGVNYFWNPVYNCPEIRPKISEILDIRRKISGI